MPRMTDSPNETAPQPNHAFAKGIALGLGVLLLGGTALLITLLVTRDPVPEVRDMPAIALEPGERVTDVALHENQALLVIEGVGGAQRVLLVNFATGERVPVEIRTP